MSLIVSWSDIALIQIKKSHQAAPWLAVKDFLFQYVQIILRTIER